MTGTIPHTVAENAYRAYLNALLAGDRRQAFAVIERAHGDGLDVGEVYLLVFQRALREIGRLWQHNRISVADEHLATAITQAAMTRLYDQVFVWRPGAGHTIIAACADIERHEIGLRMLCDLLEMEGWETTYLGASVPIESLVAMVQRRRPTAVALSAALTPHLPRLQVMIRAIRDVMGDAQPLILVGGRPFLDDPDLATRLGADLTAPDAASAVTALRTRLREAR